LETVKSGNQQTVKTKCKTKAILLLFIITPVGSTYKNYIYTA